MAEQEKGPVIPPPANPYKGSWKHALGCMAGVSYLRFTGATTRIKWVRNAEVDALEKAGKNFIYAIWHNRQVFLMYTQRDTKACALVSLSKDGEYMARILRHFGMEAVRGSTSKGGTMALLALLDKAQEGWHPVITPDGPRGPARKVQQGVLFLAQKTGLPIVPIACGLSHKLTFNSWDKFQFPLPFGRSAVVYGRPISIAENDDLSVKTAEIQAELDLVTDQADRLS